MIENFIDIQNIDRKHIKEIEEAASDIFKSLDYRKQKEYTQHGTTSVLKHEILVCIECLKIADKMENINRKLLIRAALLHDYFGYDWHDGIHGGPKHAFGHANFAANNALKDFKISKKEENIIRSHMFPLGLEVPKSKEAWILFMADKSSALQETVIPRIQKVTNR